MKLLILIFKFILCIILMVSISVLILINLATSTILNKEYVLNKFIETGYYEEIKKEAESNFENYVQQSGFDENVMENILSADKLEKDTKIIINNIYDSTNEAIDTTEIENNLRNNISTSLKNQKIDAMQQRAIDQYVTKISESYKQTILSTKYETKLNDILIKTNKAAEIAKKALIITIAIVAVIILIANYQKIVRAISQLGISLTSSGALYIICNIYINSKVKIENIKVFNDAISEVIIKILTEITNNILNYGIILLLCGLFAIILSNIIGNRKEKAE